MKSAWVVGLLANLLACGSSGTGGGNGGGQCESSCGRLVSCNAGGDICAPGACATFTDRWRPEFSSAYFGCLLDPNTPCASASVESCLSKAAMGLPARQSDRDYTSACLDKRTACAGAFADDYCGSALLSDAWLGQAQACLAKPCAEAKTCLAAIFR